MTRVLFVFVLLACFFYTFQANPLPQDEQPQPVPSDLDRLADKVNELWNKAKGTIEDRVEQLMNNPTINDAIGKTKSLLDQAGETIRKETEKIGDKLRD